MGTQRIAVLLSGSGRTLDNFHQKIINGTLNAEIVAVSGSSSKALGVNKARDYGYPAFCSDEKNHARLSKEINSFILPFNPDLIVLAGYMKLYSLPEGYEGKVLNIHPALIPSFSGKGFYGMKVHQAVIESGVRVTGCTVHFVSEKYDEGPIIMQKCVPVYSDDTADTVAHRVFEAECDVYPASIQLFADNKIKLIENKVIIEDEHD